MLEGVLYSDPPSAQRALATLIADELEHTGPIQVIVLPDECWAVDMPEARGAAHGLVVAPRITGSDIDAVHWEALPRKREGGPTPGAQPVVAEQMGVRPSMVHELLELAEVADTGS